MDTTALIDDTLADTLHAARYLALASRSATRQPSVGVALACRVSDDLRTLRVLLLRDQQGVLLTHLLICGRIALAAAVPASHHCVQLKGSDATVAETSQEDWLWLQQHVATQPAHGPAPLTHTDLVTVRFTPEQIIWQAAPGMRSDA